MSSHDWINVADKLPKTMRSDLNLEIKTDKQFIYIGRYNGNGEWFVLVDSCASSFRCLYHLNNDILIDNLEGTKKILIGIAGASMDAFGKVTHWRKL